MSVVDPRTKKSIWGGLYGYIRNPSSSSNSTYVGDGSQQPDTDPTGHVQDPSGGASMGGGSFWSRLMQATGAQRSDTPGEKEFAYDKYGRLLMNPLDAYGKAARWTNFDPSQFWYTDQGNERDRATILKGVDPWLNRYRDMQAQGLLTQADANMLADHYLRGVGVPSQLQGGNRPDWLTQYIIDALRSLGATNI